MDQLDIREWLLTNGLGSFASGTVSDVHTRTYHGWLVAALDPPGQRTLLLSHIDASLNVKGCTFELATHFWSSGAISPLGYQLLTHFQINPIPTWTWCGEGWHLHRRLLMPYGLRASPEGKPRFANSVLVDYHYQGQEVAVLQLRPFIGDRIFHYQQHANPDLKFVQVVEPDGILLQAKNPAWVGTPWQLGWSQGNYQPDGIWYWGYCYPEETRRGLSDREDLYTPGILTVALRPGDRVTLVAQVRHPDYTNYPIDAQTFDRALEAEQARLRGVAGLSQVQDRTEGQVPLQSPHPAPGSVGERLLRAGDQFVAYRASTDSPTVIAGYPWFNDWGRDTLIALPGLTLTCRRYDLAKGLLRTFGQFCQQGLIPNSFLDAGTQPFYNSLDAALWWIESLGLYLEATADWEFLVEQYPIVWRIYKGLMAGTLYGIRVDAFDGLVTWDAPNVALTWMDAVIKEEPVTPRRGKPVEINALWYSALCWAEQWVAHLQETEQMDRTALSNQARRYAYQIEQVRASMQKFWNPACGYLYDTIAPDDYPDASIRPNAVIALSLHHCSFSEAVGQQVMQVARSRLLTPYGLRSLDPDDPRYVGKYWGGIWQRDQAYHQGSVWSWLIGPFIRAWERFYPNEPVPFDWQPLLDHFQHQACLDSISEIFDGDPPHTPRGAVAQAWSVAEIIRHWLPDAAIK